ncbi:hypothetical protein MHU86_10200 [Fragilaria crotonensis]|nr:hypothetical protein MHU86_10200 [Fragilaria crotonensis]
MTNTIGADKSNYSAVVLRSLFLSCLGLIHLIAFWSYYAQFPGLLSSSGIEPVHRLLRYAAPTLHRQGYTDDDSLCELVAILGMLVGAIIGSGLCQHGILFALQAALYSLLVRTGGNFYSFQWDTLLLETTAITALSYAPWLRLRPNSASPLSPWPLRFLLFKLMYMSGVVKLQARCPTWLNMTALEYHFSTQCLPGPLAWHAQQVHPFLLRCGVAVTLWVEIPGTILLLMPFAPMRRTGAILQLLLQLFIILTGSYNFFNLLTMTLCIPVMEDATSSRKASKRHLFLCHIACGIFALWTLLCMFELSIVNHALSIRLLMTPQEIDRYTDALLPFVVFGLVTAVAFQTLRQSASHRSPNTVIHGIVCILVIGMTALPFFSLTQTLQRRGFVGSTTFFAPLYQEYARPYHLSNGYGLFRRMTGVGASPDGVVGWAGLPPSLVERPEIILEAQLENGEWQELNFRWKPGNVTSLPRQVAPHQPRLDWQMWFAALGQLNHNPWFIHLIKKLLDGCEPVWDLLGDPLASERKVQRIRAKLYHYDFTRIKTDWSTKLPGAHVLPGNGTFWSSILTLQPETVWSRTLSHEYMGPVEVGNPSITEYVKAHGYMSVCVDAKRRCEQDGNALCWVAKTIRSHQLHLLFPLLFVMLSATTVRRRLLDRRANAFVNVPTHEKHD